MKPFKIENAKTRFFESKEQYQQFTQAWKDFHNTEPLVEWRDKDITPWQTRWKNLNKGYEPVYAKEKHSVLSSPHYMIYNLLRGYDITRGYQPLTNKGRLCANYADYKTPDPWASCRRAAEAIARIGNNLKELDDATPARTDYLCRQFIEYTIPFGDTLTAEMLIELGTLLYAYLNGEEQIEDKVVVTNSISRTEALSICRYNKEREEERRAAFEEQLSQPTVLERLSQIFSGKSQ